MNKTKKTHPGVDIPDEAIRYILSKYLLKRQSDGVPVIAGINPDVAESVLELFIEWASKNGYLKDGILDFNK